MCLGKVALPPVSQSAWWYLYGSGDNSSMMTCTGFDYVSFNRLHGLLFPTQIARPGHPSILNTHARLGLVLHYLNSSMMQKTLCQIFSATEAIISRDLNRMLTLLCEKLPTIEDAKVRWPRIDEMERLSAAVNEYHNNSYHVFGFVDGVSFSIEDDSDSEMQNAYYNGWKARSTVSNIFAYGSDGCCIWARINCPGSWHDSHVAQPLIAMMAACPAPYCLVADSAFPSRGLLDEKIRTPAKSNQCLTRQQELYSNKITSLRQACEWGMRALEGGFGRLKTTLTVDKDIRFAIIFSCVHLFNIRTRWTAVNQIRTVYDPRWGQCSVYKSNNTSIARFYRIIE